MYEIENQLHNTGIELIAGVDEAGRGPLAGPVFAAAVILRQGDVIEGINDSKKLTQKKRETLFDVIRDKSLAYSIKMVDEITIDKVNIRNASFIAMASAVEDLKVRPDYVLIDGNAIKYIDIPHSCIVKGDSKCVSIAAASILAKVARDMFMLKCHEYYPEYEFDKHKGYPTKLHYEKLHAHGISPIHRLTFLKRFYGEKNAL